MAAAKRSEARTTEVDLQGVAEMGRHWGAWMIIRDATAREGRAGHGTERVEGRAVGVMGVCLAWKVAALQWLQQKEGWQRCGPGLDWSVVLEARRNGSCRKEQGADDGYELADLQGR